MLTIQALQARAAVLALLSNPREQARIAWQRLAPSSVSAWDFFLRAERCAMFVRAKLGEYDLAQETAPDVVALIGTRARLELQRALSARAQLQRVGKKANQHGWKVIVLKGGAMLATGEHIDVHDVDVLMTSEAGAALARSLDVTGYSALAPTDEHAHHHLSPRYESNTVAIEIHRTVEGFSDSHALIEHAVQCRNNPGFWQLAPADHLWHLLIHSAIQHPDRGGTVRDTSLIAHGITMCTPDDLRIVMTRIDAHRKAQLLRDAFSLAEAFRETHPIRDPFLDVALRKYVLLARYQGRSSNLRKRALMFVCGDRSIVRALRKDLSLPFHVPSESASLNRFSRMVGLLSPAVRQVARVGRLSMVAGIAMRNSWDVRQVRHHLPEKTAMKA